MSRCPRCGVELNALNNAVASVWTVDEKGRPVKVDVCEKYHRPVVAGELSRETSSPADPRSPK